MHCVWWMLTACSVSCWLWRGGLAWCCKHYMVLFVCNINQGGIPFVQFFLQSCCIYFGWRLCLHNFTCFIQDVIPDARGPRLCNFYTWHFFFHNFSTPNLWMTCTIFYASGCHLAVSIWTRLILDPFHQSTYRFGCLMKCCCFSPSQFARLPLDYSHLLVLCMVIVLCLSIHRSRN